MGDYPKIAKNAFAHIEKQTVPLVVYKSNGDRIIIGEATVEGTDTGLNIIQTKITDDRYKNLLNNDLKDISFGEKI